MPLLVEHQRTDQWKAAHKGRITASIAPACLGISPWMSARKAWRIILGLETETVNRSMQRGEDGETFARSAYEIETGAFVLETGFWLAPAPLDWLGASPDGLVDDGLCEFKCPASLPTETPLHYRVQMDVQMIVTGKRWCDFFAWTRDGHYLERHRHDDDRQLALLERLEAFYVDYVLTRMEPPKTNKAASYQDVLGLFARKEAA